MPDRADARSNSDWSVALLSLFTLVTFAVAQSVYEVLAINQDFLALRGVSNGQLLDVILVFNALPALFLFFLWIFLRRFHPGLARWFLAAVCGFLFLAFFLQIHNAYLYDRQPVPRSYLLWLLPAGLLGGVALRWEKAFRSFVTVLSPVVVIFPILFLLRTWADRDFRPPERANAVASAAPSLNTEKRPPLFLLVLDELALPALLDAQGQIDGARFPHFKELAGQSHWFRNATANSDQTIFSIPALLTGDLPLRGAPSFAYYPDNLFTLLQPDYEIYVYESLTQFCQPERFHCLSATRQGPASRLDFLRDVFYLFADRVVPSDIHLGLPDLRKTWGPFRDPPGLIRARLQRFEKVMDTLATLPAGENVFLFFHHMLPHSPYILTADGQLTDASPHDFRPAFKGNEALLRTLREQYRAQIAYADKELGRFLQQLRRAGLYDRSLLIVTADHGVSYDPQAPGRALTEVDGVVANAGLILRVPLFIKLPFQRTGALSDQDAQLIDLVPTIAEVLHREIPWPHTGRSLFAPQEARRPKIAYDEAKKRYEFPPDLALRPLPTALGQPR
jgi:hypothetical protein